MKSTTAQTEFDSDGELNNFTFQYPNILLCNYQGYTLSKMIYPFFKSIITLKTKTLSWVYESTFKIENSNTLSEL